MSNFYSNCQKWGNELLVRGVSDDQRYMEKVKFKPTLFSTMGEIKPASKWKTLDEVPLSVYKFKSMRGASDFIDQYSEVSNFPIYGNAGFIYQYLSEQYSGKVEFDPSLLKIFILDMGWPDALDF